MANYFSKDFRCGLKILFEGEPYTIESSEFVKPGKGQAFVRVKMRRLLTGNRIEKTFKSNDSAESADILDIVLQYCYHDSNFYYFMNLETFEQFQIEITLVSSVKKWLQNNTECIVTLWNNQPIAIQPPYFIEAKVIDTDPGLKGDSTNNSMKTATLSTGAVIKVPLFVQIDDFVKVDTRSGEYVSRIKSIK